MDNLHDLTTQNRNEFYKSKREGRKKGVLYGIVIGFSLTIFLLTQYILGNGKIGEAKNGFIVLGILILSFGYWLNHDYSGDEFNDLQRKSGINRLRNEAHTYAAMQTALFTIAWIFFLNAFKLGLFKNFPLLVNDLAMDSFLINVIILFLSIVIIIYRALNY